VDQRFTRFTIHTLELDCTSHSGIQCTRSTQAAVIYGTFSWLQLQSLLISYGKTL